MFIWRSGHYSYTKLVDHVYGQCYHLGRIQKHLGGGPLGGPVEYYLGCFIEVEGSASCGRHHALAGLWMAEVKGAEQQRAFVFLPALQSVWCDQPPQAPAAHCSTMNCELSPSYIASVRLFYYSNRKRNRQVLMHNYKSHHFCGLIIMQFRTYILSDQVFLVCL